jgi:hypothetical protein
MPQTVTIAAFVLGAIFLLIAVLGGQFEAFGFKLPEQSGKNVRIASALLSIPFILYGIIQNTRGPAAQTVAAQSTPAAQAATAQPAPAQPAPQRATLAGQYRLLSFTFNGASVYSQGSMQLVPIGRDAYSYETRASNDYREDRFTGQMRRDGDRWIVTVETSTDPSDFPVNSSTSNALDVNGGMLTFTNPYATTQWERI